MIQLLSIHKYEGSLHDWCGDLPTFMKNRTFFFFLIEMKTSHHNNRNKRRRPVVETFIIQFEVCETAERKIKFRAGHQGGWGHGRELEQNEQTKQICKTSDYTREQRSMSALERQPKTGGAKKKEKKRNKTENNPKNWDLSR